VNGSLLNSYYSFKLFSLCLSEGIVPHRNTVLENWTYDDGDVKIEKCLLKSPALFSCFKKYNFYVAFYHVINM